jgi:hypothetical protein
MEQLMNERNEDDMTVKAIIARFLAETPEPSLEQWKQVIEQHKHIAGEIADAALLRSRVSHLTDEDIEAPLNVDAFKASVSKAINLVYKTPSPIAMHLEQRVSEMRGPAVKPIAVELGLAAAPALLASVLAGTVQAPKKVLASLAKKFEISTVVLHEFFLSCLTRQEVPAFKAELGKPEIAVVQIAWADAVRASQLSEQETQKLLELDD